jgi:hypothetical protein
MEFLIYNVEHNCVYKYKYINIIEKVIYLTGVSNDRLCGLGARVPAYRSGGPVRFPALPEKKVVSLERGPLSLVSTTEELLDRKVAAPV